MVHMKTRLYLKLKFQGTLEVAIELNLKMHMVC